MPRVDQVVADLADHGITLPPGQVRLDHYGDSPELSRSLLDMIRSGQKRAGTGLLWLHEHENEPYGAVGDIEIVLTHDHRPSVVTRITRVEVVPYGQVTAQYAAIEGEGDGSLTYWREAHWAYFSRVCAQIGRTPSEEMLVICSTFEVLHVLPEPGAA
ncbi:MAG: ASCH domain-containing protein [Piscinibacter sp.]